MVKRSYASKLRELKGRYGAEGEGQKLKRARGKKVEEKRKEKAKEN